MAKVKIDREVVKNALGRIGKGEYGEEAKNVLWDMNYNCARYHNGASIFMKALTEALRDELGIETQEETPEALKKGQKQDHEPPVETDDGVGCVTLP